MLAYYEAVSLLVLATWLFVERRERWDGPEFMGALIISALWPAFLVAFALFLVVGADDRER
jgi:hypothetical protein